MTEGNLLYYGDNLDVLRRHVRDESVDLVYLDPPFKSNANYNLLFKEHGEKSAAQVQAFEDTWEWDESARAAYEDVVEAGGKVADTMRAFRTMLGTVDMLAYLAMMAPRLVELRRVLKPTGSLYLHCDPTASHYLKVLLDAVFGAGNFRNEIAWQRTFAHGSARRWGDVHDVLLFYSESSAYSWNAVQQEYDQSYVEGKYRYSDERGRYRLVVLTAPGTTHGDSGKPWRGYDPTSAGRHWTAPRQALNGLASAGVAIPPTLHAQLDLLYENGLIRFPAKAGGVAGVPEYKYYLSGGAPIQDVITDVPPINSQARERLGYPTQKPTALLRRIVEASSNPGDVVLDPFCGCGTTIDAAQELGRRWIGIDITHLAIGLIRHRLADRYGPEITKTYRVVGEPTTADDAAVLARDDPFQFQAWALGLVGARPAGETKKGGDKGIDGRLYFHDSAGGDSRQIIFSVKAGKLVPGYVRDLRGVLEREGAEIGVLLSFEVPSAGMRAEAAEAGFYVSPWGRHPRIQLRTIADLLDGRELDYPHVTGANVTHRRAPRARAAEAEPMELFGRAAEEPADYGDSD